VNRRPVSTGAGLKSAWPVRSSSVVPSLRPPQVQAVPFVSRPMECLEPALMEAKAALGTPTPLGVEPEPEEPTCLCPSYPQVQMLPSRSMAMLCSAPALTAMKVTPACVTAGPGCLLLWGSSRPS